MTRYAKKVDGNHSEIRNGLRKLGWTVRDYSAQGDGVPDLCVQILFGYSLFLEIKDPNNPNKARHELTKAEKEWMEFNASITRKVFTLEEALRVLAEYKKELLCMLSRRAE